MHLVILMLLLVAAALLVARMLPAEGGLVRFTRGALYAVALGALALSLWAVVAAVLGI